MFSSVRSPKLQPSWVRYKTKDQRCSVWKLSTVHTKLYFSNEWTIYNNYVSGIHQQKKKKYKMYKELTITKQRLVLKTTLKKLNYTVWSTMD